MRRIKIKSNGLFIDYDKNPEEFFPSEKGRFLAKDELLSVIRIIKQYLNAEICVE
jgi:hypothetical protein